MHYGFLTACAVAGFFKKLPRSAQMLQGPVLVVISVLLFCLLVLHMLGPKLDESATGFGMIIPTDVLHVPPHPADGKLAQGLRVGRPTHCLSLWTEEIARNLAARSGLRCAGSFGGCLRGP